MKSRFLFLLLATALACPAQKRLVLIDQDGTGPGGSGQMSILALIEAPQVEVLGITMVTGDGWMQEETRNTLTWTEQTKPATATHVVQAQMDLDLAKFQKLFVELMTK